MKKDKLPLFLIKPRLLFMVILFIILPVVSVVTELFFSFNQYSQNNFVEVRDFSSDPQFVLTGGPNAIYTQVVFDSEAEILSIFLAKSPQSKICIDERSRLEDAFAFYSYNEFRLSVILTDNPNLEKICNNHKGQFAFFELNRPYRPNYYFFPFDHTFVTVNIELKKVTGECFSEIQSCTSSSTDTGMVISTHTGYIRALQSDIVFGQAIDSAESASLAMVVFRRDSSRFIVPMVVFASLVLIIISLFIEELGDFLQSNLAILFGLLGFRQVVVPFRSQDHIALDEVILNLYFVLILSVFVRLFGVRLMSFIITKRRRRKDEQDLLQRLLDSE